MITVVQSRCSVSVFPQFVLSQTWCLEEKLWDFEEWKVKGPMIVSHINVWEHITLLCALHVFIPLIYEQQRRPCSTLDHFNQKLLLVG